MASDELSAELIERLKERASDPHRRTDAASLSASTVSLDNLLGQLGGANPQLSGFMGQFANVMKGFGVVAPMPVGDRARGRDPTPLPAAASEDEIAATEQALGRRLPPQLAQLYREIADGGFGPAGGLFPLARIRDEYHEMTREPAGPQNQAWPPQLLPLVDAEPGYDCIDLDSGEIIAWDPEELDSYSNAAWKRSFKPVASGLSDWLDSWLARPSSGDALQQQLSDVREHPGEFHIRNMIEMYGRMSPEERAAKGLPETGWEQAVRDKFERRFGMKPSE